MTRVGGEGVDEVGFVLFCFSSLGHRADGNVSGLWSSQGKAGEDVS